VIERRQFRNYRRHHPRKRMIQYTVKFRLQYRPVITGYPLSAGMTALAYCLTPYTPAPA